MNDNKNNNRWYLRTIGRMHKNLINLRMEEEKMSEVSNPLILVALYEHFENQSASQKELAELLGVKPPTVALSVKRMMQAGLLEKSCDPKDMRCNKISLSKKGEDHLKHCKPIIDEIDENLFKGFSDQEIQTLEKMLLRMIGNLQEMGVQLPKDLEMKMNTEKELTLRKETI